MNKIEATNEQLQYWQSRAKRAEEQLKKEQMKSTTISHWVERNFGPEYQIFRQTFLKK